MHDMRDDATLGRRDMLARLAGLPDHVPVLVDPHVPRTVREHLETLLPAASRLIEAPQPAHVGQAPCAAQAEQHRPIAAARKGETHLDGIPGVHVCAPRSLRAILEQDRLRNPYPAVWERHAGHCDPQCHPSD